MNVFITGATSGLGRVNIFLPVFLKRKKGIFVAISSLSTYRAINANRIAYPASKSDLTMVFEAIRIQFISRPLRFISFQIGRMGEGQTLLQASYQAIRGQRRRLLIISARIKRKTLLIFHLFKPY